MRLGDVLIKPGQGTASPAPVAAGGGHPVARLLVASALASSIGSKPAPKHRRKAKHKKRR